MGNSNSIPNSKQRFTLEELHSYYQQEGLNFNSSSDNRRSLRHNNNNENHHDNQQIQSRLTDAYLHETYHDHQHQQQQQSTSLPQIAHVKVLPDFNPDGARLRCTTNGNILNSGGTISGRKEQQQQQQQLDLPPITEPFIQSFSPSSSSSPSQLPSSSSVQIIRNRSSAPPSSVSAQIIRNKSFEQLHLKDLNRRNYIQQSTKIEPINQQRNSSNINTNKNLQNENSLGQRNHYHNNNNDMNNRNSNNNKLNLFSSSGKTNIVKCKKKKSAPLPPPIITTRNSNNHENMIITNRNNNHLINSYDSKLLQKQQSNQNNQLSSGQQKKLRLFKTNAESKKSLPLASSSASNNNTTTQYHHQNNNSRGNNNNNDHHHIGLTGLIGNDKNPKIGINNYKDSSRVKLFPTPIIFRREKSFDASLLLNHRKQYNDNNNNNNNNNNNDKIDLKHNNNYNQNIKLQRDAIDSSKLKNIQQRDFNHHNERSPNIKKSHLETKINKIITQPSQIFKNNFKKELEEATKNRRNSISAIDLTSLNSINYDIKETSNRNDKDFNDNNNRKLSNRIITTQNNEKICNNNLIKDNQNISQLQQSTSKKFYFGMGAGNKKNNDNENNDEPIIDIHEKLSGSSLSDRAIENRILSQQIIDKHPPIDFMDEFDKHFINHKELNSLSSGSVVDDILIRDINDSSASPQLYKIPINCTHTNLDDDTGDIQLNVRPTLPRRQLEIPRFSPAAAWRMLNDEQKKLLKNLSNNRKLTILNSSTETLPSPDLMKQQQQPQPTPPIIEERIQRIFREPPLMYSDNKSGDSGISGDDGVLQLDGGTDSPGINFIQDAQNNNNNNNKHQILGPTVSSSVNQKCIGNFSIPWTPQQDLEDDDDDDEMSSLEGNNVGNMLTDDPEAIRGHVFSVSLPREGHQQGTSYGDKEKFGFSSLQKLKRTVSGAFLAGGNCTSNNNSTTQIINSNNLNSLQNNIQQTSTRLSNYCSDNWLLSCSALNSIENSQNSSINNKENSQAQQHSKTKSLNQHQIDGNLINSSATNKGNELLNDDNSNFQGSPITNTNSSKIQPSSLNYVTTGRHMMYLPNRIKDNNNDIIQSTTASNEYTNKNNKKQLNNLSNKSNNKKDNSKKEILRENLQDSMPVFKDKKSAVINRTKNSSNHRFTFQSTVRQIERRRISERLSKEAEEKEALRKSELEAMTRVEEEFQRKRAREKATICHQLRLYSMEENNNNQCTSLPIDFPQIYNDESTELKNDLTSLQKLPIQQIRKNSKINKFNNNNNRNFRAEPDGAVSNSPPPSPSYSQNNHKYNNNYYDDEYFNISDDTKGLQNSNQRQRKNSINLNYFQKTAYLDELNIPNRSPIQRYNNDNTKLLHDADKIGRRHNNNNEYDSESDISEKNDIRMKYRRHNGELR